MTGQFLSIDPELSTTNQAYAYAGDDPVNESDPTGLQPAVGYCPNRVIGSNCYILFQVLRGAWDQYFCYYEGTHIGCLEPSVQKVCFAAPGLRCAYTYAGGGPGALPLAWVVNGNDPDIVETSIRPIQ